MGQVSRYQPGDFALVASDDPLQEDLDLTCLLCGAVPCAVQPGDDLATLSTVAQHHFAEVHK